MAKIARVDCYPVSIPLRTPMVLASERIDAALNLIVRITDSDGQCGWGESASAPTMNGELLAGMNAAVRQRIGPALLGAAVSRHTLPNLVERLDRSIKGNTGAKAAVDIALTDLVARQATIPFHAVLGERRHDRIPLIAMIGGADFLAATENARSDGFTHFKIKVGSADISTDVRKTKAVREMIGAGHHLSADANMAWDVDGARAYLSSVDAYDLAYLEQPLRDDDRAGFGILARACQTPLCLDEGLHTLDDLDFYGESASVQGAGLKALKFGTIARFMAASKILCRYKMVPVVASKIAETSIGSAASLHLSALTHTCAWGVSLTHRYLVDDVVEHPLSSRGVASVPSGIGLGVEPVVSKILRYAVRV